MAVHGKQYNTENGAVYEKSGKEIKGVLEFITPEIQGWYGDTTVLSIPYCYKYSADESGQKERR